MNIRRNTIYLVSFPFSENIQETKLRPALALTDENNLKAAVFCGISSQVYKLHTGNTSYIPIIPSGQNGLKTESVIVLGELFTLYRSVYLKGTL